MNSALEQLLWNAGQGNESYTKETWHNIIDALLDDFTPLIGQDFQRDPEINLDITRPCSPSFGANIAKLSPGAN